jgi:hypothetical protein
MTSTPTDTTYLLDANVFMQAKDAHYRFSFCPAFWEFLVAARREDKLLSIDKILGEIATGGGDLQAFASVRLGDGFFRDSGDSAVVAEFARLTAWVLGQPQYFEAAKTEFANGVDGWLIAYARIFGCTVVTHEVHAPEARRKVPIPNICLEFGISCCTTFEMLDTLKPQFILA